MAEREIPPWPTVQEPDPQLRARAGRQLAQLIHELDQLRAEAKATAKDYRDRIQRLELSAAALAQQIRTGEFQSGLFDGAGTEA